MQQPAGPTAGAGPASGARALYTPEDLSFLDHMIMHHAQAVEMAALMEGRTTRAELIRFAGYLADAQSVEIDMMHSLLEMAQSRGLVVPTHEMGGDPMMAGMLSSAEMAALAASKGAEFERRWLEGMIVHHEGGLAMSRVQELQQAAEGRQPYGLAVILDEILVVQRAEIAQMHRWLDEWGLASQADWRAPAIDISTPLQGTDISHGVPMTLYGVAVDDTSIAGVRVGIHDLTRDRWLHADGSWGVRTLREAERIGSEPSVAWLLTFTPPSRGRYALNAEVEDVAGNRTAAAARVFEVK